MKFERHHRILKELSISGVVKVSNLAKSLKVTKETIRSDLNELAGQDILLAVMVVHLLPLILLITSQKMKLLMCWKNMNQRRK